MCVSKYRCNVSQAATVSYQGKWRVGGRGEGNKRVSRGKGRANGRCRKGEYKRVSRGANGRGRK